VHWVRPLRHAELRPHARSAMEFPGTRIDGCGSSVP
jgi:hypothetical protein